MRGGQGFFMVQILKKSTALAETSSVKLVLITSKYQRLVLPQGKHGGNNVSALAKLSLLITAWSGVQCAMGNIGLSVLWWTQ